MLVFCLIERQIRHALGPKQTMTGLHPDNLCVRPTGRMTFYHLGELTPRIGNVTDPPTRPHHPPASNSFLDLLDTSLGQTRCPQT